MMSVHRRLCCPAIAVPLLAALLVVWPAAAHPRHASAVVSLSIDINDERVEQQVMVPLAQVLEEWFGGMSLEDFRATHPDDIREVLARQHREANPLTADGLAVQPVITDHGLEAPATEVPDAAIPPEDFVAHGFLRYVATYPTVGRPGRVEVVWGLYALEPEDAIAEAFRLPAAPDRARQPVVAELHAFGVRKLHVLSEREPAYTWHGERSVPAVSLRTDESATAPPAPARRVPAGSLAVLGVGLLSAVAVGRARSMAWAGGVVVATLAVAGLVYPMLSVELPHDTEAVTVQRPGEAEAIDIFTLLHRNIYRAFDYNTDSAIYDALAQSVDGPELEAIYHDVYASLILKEEGGAVCSVQAVEIRSAEVVAVPDEAAALYRETIAPDATEPEAGALFAVRCAWTVRGLVSHFGHTHERLNAFEATYTLAPRRGAWRIIDTQLHAQERLDRPDDDASRPLMPNLDNLLEEDAP